MASKNCIFCLIAQHKAPADIVHEDEFVIAFKSINPVASTHLLIIPKQHIETFIDLKQSDKHLTSMASVAQKLVKKFKIETGYKLVFNGGRYQEIPHLHWHLLGGKFFNLNDPLNNT